MAVCALSLRCNMLETLYCRRQGCTAFWPANKFASSCRNIPSQTQVPKVPLKANQDKNIWRMQAAIEARRSLEVQKLSNNLGAVRRKKLGKLDAAYEVHQVLCCCCMLVQASKPSAAAPFCCRIMMHALVVACSALWQPYIGPVIPP